MFIILSLISCNKDIRYVYENEETGNYCIDGSCKRLKNNRVITHDINSFTYDITKDLCPLCVSDKDRESIKSKIIPIIKHNKEIENDKRYEKQRKALYDSLIKYYGFKYSSFNVFLRTIKNDEKRLNIFNEMREKGFDGEFSKFNEALGF